MSRPASQLLSPRDLARFDNLQLLARRIVEGFISGLHRSPYHGFSVEFAEYREYAPGDDLRYFDWKAYGKSDRLYIKKFHSETNTALRLVVDRSASMGFASGEVSKFRYASCLAAALAFVAARQQDAVGLLACAAGGDRALPPRGGQGRLQELFGLLEACRPEGETNLAAALHALAESARRRSLVVVLSDLWEEPEDLASALRHLRFKGHEVLLFQVLDPAELDFPYRELVDFRDLETGRRLQVHAFAYRRRYRKLAAEFIARLRRVCTEGEMEFRQALTTRPFAPWLAAYLHRRRRLAR